MVAFGCLRLKRTFLLFVVSLIGGVIFLLITSSQNENIEDDISIEIRPSDANIIQIDYFPGLAKPCSSNGPRLLAIVHSSPTHILHRKAIRQTWGSSERNPDLRTVFIVGNSKVPKVRQRIYWEAKEHGDIILLKMVDSYKNLTLKHLSGLRWAVENCPAVSFVMKADDDAFIDTKRIMGILQLILGAKSLSRDALACHVMPDGTPPRRTGKWKVTEKEYPFEEYPEYCSGLAYFAHPNTMAKIYDSAISGGVPFLWIDDVFVTGLVAGVEKIRRVDLGVWYANMEQQVMEWSKETGSVRPCPWMVAEISPRNWPVEAFRLWNKTERAWNQKAKSEVI